VLDAFFQNHLALANRAAFVGGANGLDFEESSPEWLTASPVGHIALRATRAKDSDGWQLVALWKGAGQRPHESLILDHIAGAEFSYFGGAAGDAPRWRSDWPGPAAPSLVRLRFTPATDRPVEEMIVALRLADQGTEP
jgi:hypothetical protein